MNERSDLATTKEVILDATMACIVRYGIDGTSLRNVARQANVSLGLLSYHFDDKRSLIVAAFQRATDRLLAATLESLDGIEDPTDRVKAFIRGAYASEFLDSDYLALRISLWAIARSDRQIADVERNLVERYGGQMGRLILAASARLSAEQVRQRVTDVIVIQNGLWLDWARYANQTDLERGLRRCDEVALL